MRILRVIPSMNPVIGGPCQGIRNIIPILENRGIVNEVVCLDSPSNMYLVEDPFTIYKIGPVISSLSYSSQLLPWLKKNIVKYDIIIIHGIWQFHSYAVNKCIGDLRRKNFSPIPKVVIIPHGMLDPWFQKAKERRWKALRNYIYWELIEKKVINNADAIFFTCEEELLQARNTFRQYQPKSEINVSYGIKKPPEYNSQMRDTFFNNIPSLIDQKYWLFLSRIDPKKGIDLLVNAYKLLLENSKYRGIEIPKLLIAGPGFEGNYGLSIKKMANNSPLLKENIIFSDMIKGDVKWGALYGCEAFILPSHQENFGIAVVEALACGKPVLISDKINIWREIVRGGSGIIDANTIEGTFNNLEKWIKFTVEQKREMSKNAVNTFEEYFSISIGVKGFYDGLVKVLNS